LQAVAERLTQCVKPGDTVARLSGDEFSIILSKLSQKQEADEIAQHMVRRLSEPYRLNDQEVRIQTSIGITFYPEDDCPLDQLLNHADIAMRRAKEYSGSHYEFYSAQLDALIAEQQLLEAKLNGALERGEFELYYQPQVNLVTKRIIGVEALLRWNNPELGLVYPGQFISIAEATGLIVPIGEWVLRTACIQAQIWQENSPFPMRVSVNLSGRQFKEQNLLATIANILSQTNLNPDLLVLELTETSIMEDLENTISTLEKLKAMGVQVSIDDFGIGYSSLNYLKRLPLDTLKIDQSFIRNIATDSNDAAISTAIIAMAQSLKLKVIAEGVETEEQLNFLRKHGCHGMQGFFFSHPIPAAELDKMLAEDKRL
ncbi:MAG: bifunctional diguanylate cyclase/phosphodiesterase, partial [Leptolyngbyaceae bacterium]|nr:bifunctional diguanylate cyclase/phosphodiesterase [Leptolyngbyaceae bacterium]